MKSSEIPPKVLLNLKILTKNVNRSLKNRLVLFPKNLLNLSSACVLKSCDFVCQIAKNQLDMFPVCHMCDINRQTDRVNM